MADLQQALADRYRIELELGQGGMATVYLAHDLRHERQVAIKVMRPELAASIGPDRFLREIRTTANLRHPHIVPLFDSGDADGHLYYVMPFVEGESLQDRLERESPLGLDETLRLAREVAGALGYAHARGVIHRDIKPGNIMLESGHAVVADFGIASAVSVAGGEKLTQTGMIVGSPAYMSPEQASGENVLDARSDLYSLACVVYEMLTGQPPFSAPTAMVVMARHMFDPVPPIATARPGLPEHVSQAVERALAKVPSDRYATTEDWIAALDGDQNVAVSGSTSVSPVAGDRPAANRETSSTGIDKTSGEVRADDGFWVAVLPFKHRGSSPDLEALAEGLTEEIVTGLSRFSYLRVIGRGATSRNADEAGDVRSIGEALGARYVMEGSIRQAGSTLRIAAQLVDASSGAHLWAETYKRAFRPEDIFALQDEVVPRIVSTAADMHGVLPHTMSEALRHRDPSTLSPYEMVLRAFGYIERLTDTEHREVRAGLEQAVERAPQNSDAWAMLSMLYAEEHKHGFNLLPDPLGRALDAARRAVAAAPSNSLAYHVLAQALFFRRELPAFRVAADRAVTLNPMDGGTAAFMGILMAYAGDWDHGCSLAEHAMELNPHHPGWYRFSSFFNAFRKHEYRAALDVALKMNLPSYFYTHVSLASVYGHLGELESARVALKDLLALKPDIAEVVRDELGGWLGHGELLELTIEGLRKAGLDVQATNDSQ